MNTITRSHSLSGISSRSRYFGLLCVFACLLVSSFACIRPAYSIPPSNAAEQPSASDELDGRPPAENLKLQLHEVLAGDEYQRQMSDATPGIIDRLIAAFFEFIGRVLSPVFEARDEIYSTSPIIYWSLISILTVILVLLLYHIFMTISGAFREPAKNRSLMGVELPPRKRATELQQAAAEAASNGDFAQAVVYLYIAAFVHLDQNNIIRFRDADTNRQLLQQLHAEPRLAQNLKPLSLKVEAITYGHHPATSTDFENADRIVGEVLSR